jgi:hypothetical protein
MSPNELPPPAPACLEKPYPSSQKGGTLIAEDVVALEEHERRLADPGGYRPASCPHCNSRVLHAHDFRERHLRGDPWRLIVVRRYRCPWCQARWQILPALVARWLWRSWRVVEQACGVASHAEVGAVTIARQTEGRWGRRLASQARSVVQALAASSAPLLESIAAAAGLNATRRALVAGFNGGLATLAGLTHRLMRGLRLM